MLQSASTERHPFRSLLLLLLLVFAGQLVFTIIGILIGGLIYGFKGQPDSLDFLRLLQIISSFGMFVAPAIFFARLESNDWLAYLKLRHFYIILALLTVMIMISFGPLLELSLEWNKSMKLPPFLSGLEEWMLLKEQQMAELTKQLLRMGTVNILLVNLLMLAIIPGVGEELIFRGCLQNILGRWTRNHHTAIWITAIIFSAIHFQFYGFIPRMLLGALFGYLLVWSGSLWLPILAHFMNNAVAVVTAYIYQQKGICLDKMDEPDRLSWYLYVLSLVLFIGLLITFYRYSVKQGVFAKGADGSRLG